MTSLQHGELRGRLKLDGMTEADLTWLDGIGWRDSAVPPIESASQQADYARREQALNRSISGLLPEQRGQSLEGRLAAAIGAQLANYKDSLEPEDD